MAGMSLDNLASQEEIDTLRRQDGMTHEPGYEQQSGGESLDALGFASLGDFSQPGSFDVPAAGAFTNSLETQAAQPPASPDWATVAAEATGKGLKAVWELLLAVGKSTGTRTADDIYHFGLNAVKLSAAVVALGIIVLIMAGVTGWSGFGFAGFGGTLFFAGLFSGGAGAIFLAVAAELKSRAPVTEEEALSEISDTVDDTVGGYVENIEASIQSIVSEDLMSELDDILSGEYPDDADSYTSYEAEDVAIAPAMPDFDALDRQLAEEKRTTGRASLVDAFLPYFMRKTPQFRDVAEIPSGSPAYDVIRTVVVKAVANLQNTSITQVAQECLSVRETFFSYKIVFERVKKLKNTKDIERELETYFRATVSDPNLSEEDILKQRLRIKATVTVSADTWEITINKGNSGIITVGDCLAGSRELAYFKNEKNALPIIAGITESGSVILEDAQHLDNIMVTGKQRSGKSWYVNALLTSILTFNSPEDVALIIVDPKNSTMFNTLALFPHVLGLHDGKNINEIFRELLDIEAVRRATKLREARCEDIKGYNAAHPTAKMPRIYVVIDEVISVRDGLLQGDEKEGKQRVKEFNSSMLTIMSKLPYVGIGLIFIPHRATGIIDKTARVLLKLKAAVMAESDEIDETLGEKIDRRLTAPGDIAMRTVSMESARYIRGPAVADADGPTAETLRRIAKGFYSMGVEVPAWDHLPVSHVRDDAHIRAELFGDTAHIQY